MAVVTTSISMGATDGGRRQARTSGVLPDARGRGPNNPHLPHLGTTLDDLLAEDGLLEDVRRVAAGRVSAWEKDKHSRSLWQVAQFGYDIFVSKQGGPMVPVTDENACVLCVRATASGAGRVYVDFEPRERSDLYVIYSAASDPDQRPQELCIRRRGAGGDTVYVSGLGHIDCRSPEPGYAVRLGGVGMPDVRPAMATRSGTTAGVNCQVASATTSSVAILPASRK